LSCRTGRTDEAETLLRDPSLGGLAAARRALFWHLKNAGQDAQLSVFATALIAQGDPKDLAKYARQLEPDGAPDTAITMWRAAAEHGDFHARWEAVRLIDANGQGDEAEAWLRDLIRADKPRSQMQTRRIPMTCRESAHSWLPGTTGGSRPGRPPGS